MAEKQESETFETKNIPWDKAPSHQDIYTNNAGISTSSYDIQLRLAQITSAGNKPVVQEVATVFMAPGQAKATALLLLRAVLEYEKQYKIEFPVPENLGKVLAAIIESAKSPTT